MSEKFTCPETAKDPEFLRFGDVVRSETYDARFLHVIIEADAQSWPHAISIVDEKEHRYGLPGTIPPQHKLEIVGRRSYQEVTEMVARAFGNGELTDENLALVQQYYPEES